MQSAQAAIYAEPREWPHILIMEDEPSVGRGIRMALNEEGYQADLALNGQEALDSFRDKTVDLLIADLRLPDIDGMDVIRQVKKKSPDTGVIVITGYSTVPSAVEAMKLGAYDYLSKPFTEDEIISAVKAALSVKAEPSPTKTVPTAEPAPEPVGHELRLIPGDQALVDELMADVRSRFTGRGEELIPLLQHAQERLGYLPQNALEEIARFTHQPPASVFGVVTFYEQFRLRPVGRHIVRVCRGTACHVKGSQRILNEINEKFHLTPGQTSQDRLLTLETVACFGSCAIAPVVVVDKSVRGRMNPSKAIKALETIRDSHRETETD